MITHHFAPWFSLLIFALSLPAKAAENQSQNSNKIKVCTASISSTAEAEVFKKNLNSGENKGKFDFVELTEMGTPADQNSGVVSGWFDRACESGVQCDMLVVSAHFSSSGFFSDATNPNPLRYPLKTKDLQKHTCEKNCKGILSNPSEVFLLACNTLSSKKLDHRTPEKYMQILKNDGAFRDRAELAVENRYGTLGPTNRSQIEFAFSGVPQLYGFKSTSQLAENNVKYLQSYFKEKPDYAQHLQKSAVENMNKSIEALNKVSSSGALNPVLMRSFPKTSICDSSGIFDDESPEGKFWRNICKLRDDKESFEARLNVVQKMLDSSERAAFTPDIEEFLHTELKARPQLTHAEQKAIDEISKLKPARDFILKQINSKKDYPSMRKKLIRMATTLKWLDAEQAKPLLEQAQEQIKLEGWDEGPLAN